MARGRATVTFKGRLFEPTLSKRVVSIIGKHLLDTAQDWPHEVGKRMRRGRGRATGRLAGSFGAAQMHTALEARSELKDSSVERYVHRVEYGTPAYGTRGQNQRKNARRVLIRKLSPKGIGTAITRELNG